MEMPDAMRRGAALWATVVPKAEPFIGDFPVACIKPP